MKLNPNLFGSAKGLIRSVGMSEDECWQSERSRDLLIERRVEVTKLADLSLQLVREAASAWGDAFKCQFSSDGIREFRALGGSPLDGTAFHEFQADVHAAAPSDTVNVSISIDKEIFGKTIFQPEAEVHFVMYIFAASFTRAFSSSFRDIDQRFFPGPKERCVCLVLEREVSLVGSNLAVLGPAAFEQYQHEIQHRAAAARLERARVTRSDHVTWINFDTRLTPYHLLLTVCAETPPDLANLVTRKLFDLTLIFIADSVRFVEGGYEATFSGVPLAQIYAPHLGAVSPINVPILFRLFHWAYLPGGTDKLAVLRAVVASVLAADRIANYETLDQSARRISQSTRASYASLVQGTVARHFDKLKEVDKYVQETGFQLGGQISGLAASLATNMLGTVGVIVGGFIGYVINQKATPKLLAFGAILYGGYLLCFPLVYSLLLQNLVQYVITVREFRERIREFGASLNLPQLSSRYEPTIRSRRNHFWALFVISCLVYVVLVAGFFCLYTYFKLVPTTPSAFND
jgi:hypothetical protein